jgi:hypothetical protein
MAFNKHTTSDGLYVSDSSRAEARMSRLLAEPPQRGARDRRAALSERPYFSGCSEHSRDDPRSFLGDFLDYLVLVESAAPGRAGVVFS